MRRAAGALVVAGLLGLPAPAGASCAGPGLQVEGLPEGVPVVLVPGQRVVVRGTDYAAGSCDDTPATGGCARAPEPAVPLRDVPLQLTRGATSQVLARADAAPDGTVRWALVLPAGTPAGPALLEADAGRIVISVAPRR